MSRYLSITIVDAFEFLSSEDCEREKRTCDEVKGIS